MEDNEGHEDAPDNDSGLGRAHRHFWKWLPPMPQARPPGLLYHYTDGYGFQGIVERDQIWATEVRFMNDRSELTYGFELMLQVLAELKGSRPRGDLMDHFEACCRNVDPIFSASGEMMFVTCFCEDGDLLSQWRAYGQMGAGYALGVDILAMPSTDVRLVKVDYDREKQRNLLRQVLDGGLAAMENAPDEVVRPRSFVPGRLAVSYETLGDMLTANLWEYFVSMKDTAFREENEWRLVWTNPVWMSEVAYRVKGGSLLAPYVKVPLRPHRQTASPVKEVVLGPGVSSRMSAMVTNHFLYENRHEEAKVKMSTVPLR